MSILLSFLNTEKYRREMIRNVFNISNVSISNVSIMFITGLLQVYEKDALQVPIHEGTETSKIGRTQGNFNALKKVCFWFRYIVVHANFYSLYALADDDTYINSNILSRLDILYDVDTSVYIGSFEWYNWIPSKYKATGWGMGPHGSSYWGQRLNNCTFQNNNRCVGPFSFAEGHFMMFNLQCIRQLVDSYDFKMDYDNIYKIENHSFKHKILHDVIIGYWMSHLQHINYIYIDRLGYYDQNSIPKHDIFIWHRYPYNKWLSRINLFTKRIRMSCGVCNALNWTLHTTERRCCFLRYAP